MSLHHRRDQRSVQTFSDNIRDYSERESIFAEALRIDFAARGHEFRVEDNGVDGEGNLIEGRLNKHTVDKRFVDDLGELLIEIKTAPEDLRSFFTFKVCSLKGCLEQDAILAVTRLREYHIFKQAAIERMLGYEHRIYFGFSPNDLAVRIPMGDIRLMAATGTAQIVEWAVPAKEMLEGYRERLTRPKSR